GCRRCGSRVDPPSEESEVDAVVEVGGHVPVDPGEVDGLAGLLEVERLLLRLPGIVRRVFEPEPLREVSLPRLPEDPEAVAPDLLRVADLVVELVDVDVGVAAAARRPSLERAERGLQREPGDPRIVGPLPRLGEEVLPERFEVRDETEEVRVARLPPRRGVVPEDVRETVPMGAGAALVPKEQGAHVRDLLRAEE